MKLDWLTKLGETTKAVYDIAKFNIKKNSPEILMTVGVISFGATVVTASVATTKAGKIIEEHRQGMADAKEALLYAKPEHNYSLKEEQMVVWRETIKKTVKLYALPMALGTLSVTSFLSAGSILQNRYYGAVAAFNAVSGAFQAYRSRVIEEMGEEADYRFRHGIKKEEIEEQYVDENGDVQIVKKVVERAQKDHFDVWFNKKTSTKCIDEMSYNLTFLKSMEQKANQIKDSRKRTGREGFFMYNEAMSLLGLDGTQSGAVTGWYGPGRISFGMKEILDGEPGRIVTDLTDEYGGVLLSFNIDGVILDRL